MVFWCTEGSRKIYLRLICSNTKVILLKFEIEEIVLKYLYTYFHSGLVQICR